MICKKCGGTMTPISEVKGKIKGRGIVSITVNLLLIVCTAGLWLIVPLLRGGSKGKIKTKTKWVCNDCAKESY